MHVGLHVLSLFRVWASYFQSQGLAAEASVWSPECGVHVQLPHTGPECGRVAWEPLIKVLCNFAKCLQMQLCMAEALQNKEQKFDAPKDECKLHI